MLAITGGGQCGVESVFCVSRSTSIYLALSYEAREICKLSRKLPADFQELPLSAVTRLVVIISLIKVDRR